MEARRLQTVGQGFGSVPEGRPCPVHPGRLRRRAPVAGFGRPPERRRKQAPAGGCGPGPVRAPEKPVRSAARGHPCLAWPHAWGGQRPRRRREPTREYQLRTALDVLLQPSELRRLGSAPEPRRGGRASASGDPRADRCRVGSGLGPAVPARPSPRVWPSMPRQHSPAPVASPIPTSTTASRPSWRGSVSRPRHALRGASAPPRLGRGQAPRDRRPRSHNQGSRSVVPRGRSAAPYGRLGRSARPIAAGALPHCPDHREHASPLQPAAGVVGAPSRTTGPDPQRAWAVVRARSPFLQTPCLSTAVAPPARLWPPRLPLTLGRTIPPGAPILPPGGWRSRPAGWPESGPTTSVGEGFRGVAPGDRDLGRSLRRAAGVPRVSASVLAADCPSACPALNPVDVPGNQATDLYRSQATLQRLELA